MTQTKYKVIGLTGGIATGKSTLTNIIRSYGHKVIDADQIAKNIVEIGKPAYNDVIESFGKEILKEDKTINRKKLGNIIFKDDIMRKKLNSILHPYIFREIKASIEEYGKNNFYVFVDIPLLVEERNKFKKYKIVFDEIWLVYIDKKTQINRLVNRDSISKKKAKERINSQMPIEEKKKFASRIIDNRGSLDDLEVNVEKIMKEII